MKNKIAAKKDVKAKIVNMCFSLYYKKQKIPAPHATINIAIRLMAWNKLRAMLSGPTPTYHHGKP